MKLALAARWPAAWLIASLFILPTAQAAPVIPGVAAKPATKTVAAPNLTALTPQWWQYLSKASAAELPARGEALLQQLQTTSQTLGITESLQPAVQQALQHYQQTLASEVAPLAEIPADARSNYDVLQVLINRYSQQLSDKTLLSQQRKLQGLREATLRNRLDRNWQQYRNGELSAAEKLETAARIVSSRLLSESEALSSDKAKIRLQQLHDAITADRHRWQKAAKNLQPHAIPTSALSQLRESERYLQQTANIASRELASAETESLLNTSAGGDTTRQLAQFLEHSTQWRRNQAEQLVLGQTLGQLEKQAGKTQLDTIGSAISLLRERAQLLPQTGDTSLATTLQALEAADAWHQAAGLRVSPPRFGISLQSLWQQSGEKLSATLFRIGDAPVTALMLLRAFLLFMAGLIISSVVRRGLVRLGEGSGFNTTTLYTLGRLSHYVIVVVALFMALASIGLNFGNLALVAGALSVGIGFGLQAIVSNFVSGLILLLDRSLKVGDYIELDTGISGTVKEIRVRSTLVTSNDNVDVLVPNSEFVNGRVMNWTHGDQTRRLHVEFQVAYGSDKTKVNDAVLAIVPTVSFSLKPTADKNPALWFMGYGDSCMNFELVVWINATGIARPSGVRATYRWAIDDALNNANIVIPHRERHIKLEKPA